jgi:hypothetical protein
VLELVALQARPDDLAGPNPDPPAGAGELAELRGAPRPLAEVLDGDQADRRDSAINGPRRGKLAIRPRMGLALDLVKSAGDVSDLACVAVSAERAARALTADVSSPPVSANRIRSVTIPSCFLIWRSPNSDTGGEFG